MFFIEVRPYAQALANGKFTANFYIFEHSGDKITTTPYYLDKQFAAEKEAAEYAEKYALVFLGKHYPKGTKYTIIKKQ